VGTGGKTVRIDIKGKSKKEYLDERKAERAKKNNPIELQ